MEERARRRDQGRPWSLGAPLFVCAAIASSIALVAGSACEVTPTFATGSSSTSSGAPQGCGACDAGTVCDAGLCVPCTPDLSCPTKTDLTPPCGAKLSDGCGGLKSCACPETYGCGVDASAPAACAPAYGTGDCLSVGLVPILDDVMFSYCDGTCTTATLCGAPAYVDAATLTGCGQSCPDGQRQLNTLKACTGECACDGGVGVVSVCVPGY